MASLSIPCDCPLKTGWPHPAPTICMLTEALPVLLHFGKWRETDQLGSIPHRYTDGESLKGISYHNFAPRFLENVQFQTL
jgi:hypothetical protein